MAGTWNVDIIAPNSGNLLNLSGSFKQTSLVKDLANGSTYTITDTDGYGYFTSSVALTASKGFNLPLAANNIGRELEFKRTDSAGNQTTGGNGFLFTIATQGSDTIDNATTTSTSLVSQYSFIRLRAESSGLWRIIGIHDWMEVTMFTATNYPSTNTFATPTNMSIPSGIWDLTHQLYTSSNSTTEILAGISTVSTSTSFSDRANGDNAMGVSTNGAGSGDVAVAVTSYRVALTAATSYYTKAVATYTTGTPQYVTRFSARRFG